MPVVVLPVWTIVVRKRMAVPPSARPAVRRDVLVEPEEVRGVVSSLDLDETVPRRARVGGSNGVPTLLAEEVDVRPQVALAHVRDEVRHPALARGPVVGAVVEGRDRG